MVLGILVENPLADDLIDPRTTYSVSLNVWPTAFRPPVDIGSRTCGKPGATLSLLQEHVAPATIATAEICYDVSYGLLVRSDATVILADTPEAGDLAGQVLELAITTHNTSRYTSYIALAAFVAFSALCLRLFGATPGKKLTWLRVTGRHPIPALRREVIRMSPFLVPGLTILAVDTLIAPDMVSASGINSFALAADIVWFALAGLVWLWPLSTWTGYFFHDRWLGLAVVDPDDLSSGSSDEPLAETDGDNHEGGART